MKFDHICVSLLMQELFSCFLSRKAGYIPKVSLSPFRGFLLFFFFLKARQPASLAQPSWLPSNSSSTPSSPYLTHPRCCRRSPRQRNSLQDGAGHEISRGKTCKALHLLLPSQKCLWLCAFPSGHAVPLSTLASPLLSCRSPDCPCLWLSLATTELTQTDTVIGTSFHALSHLPPTPTPQNLWRH